MFNLKKKYFVFYYLFAQKYFFCTNTLYFYETFVILLNEFLRNDKYSVRKF